MRAMTWWSQNIRLIMVYTSQGFSGGDPRDYLALERTYLGWFRTSIAVVSFGVAITQLFLLQGVDPTKGIALGVVFACGGMFTVLVACFRYFRLQKQLTLGKAIAGGWDINSLLLLLIAVLLMLFVIVLVET